MKDKKGDVLELGACCCCTLTARDGARVRTIIWLPVRGPVPGTGWGCVVCDLPPDGALAVLCDQCAIGMETGKRQPEHASPCKIRWACDGFAAGLRRIRREDLKVVFGHYVERHRTPVSHN